MTPKNAIAFLILLPAVTGTMIFLSLRIKVADMKASRKRDSDAYAIRDTLFIYMQQNNGALPSSLVGLKFERSDVDPSPFRLFAPETRKGQLGSNVIAEAEEGGNGKGQIVIYADGTVRWE